MPEFGEGETNKDCSLNGHVDSSGSDLDSRSHVVLDNITHDVNGSLCIGFVCLFGSILRMYHTSTREWALGRTM